MIESSEFYLREAKSVPKITPVKKTKPEKPDSVSHDSATGMIIVSVDKEKVKLTPHMARKLLSNQSLRDKIRFELLKIETHD